MTEALADNLVHFVRYLRAHGLSVVPVTTADLVRAAETVGLENRTDLKLAFRTMTTSRPEELAVFDDAFEMFFGDGGEMRPHRPDLIELGVHDRQHHRVAIPVLADRTNEGRTRDDLEESVGASAAERLMRRDFGDLTPEEAADVRRLVATMIWRPADVASRRWSPASSGNRPDLRRMLRSLVRHEGDMMPLRFSRRRPRKRPLVVFADVSGSMERYSEMLLYFMHAAQGRLGRVEAFVFSTRLTRITREIRHRDPTRAIAAASAAVADWSGGTRIGEAFEEFNWTWSRRVTRGGPIALVISDGWDCGDTEVLHDETATLARSVHRLVWLNPLAGRAGYEPATRGMRTVLPFVDHFLPAGTVRDLTDVVRLLESVPQQRRTVTRPRRAVP